MRVLVLGGTRFLGRRVSERLAEAGHRVAVANRGQTGVAPEGIESVTIDRATGSGLEALAAMRPEAVLDFSGYEAGWVRDTIKALRGARPHYIFISSGAVYRPLPELPWPETAGYGPWTIWGSYGRQKVAAERTLWQARDETGLAVTVFRFPFVMGPGNYADREAFVCSRIRAGRPILLPGGGKALNQHVHVEDAASAVIRALDLPGRSQGMVFNCAYRRAVTNRGFVELCAAALGSEVQIVAIDEAELGIRQDEVDLTDIVFPFPEHHYVLDVDLIRSRLGFEAHRDNRRIVEDFVADWIDTGAAEGDKVLRYRREEFALEALALGGH